MTKSQGLFLKLSSRIYAKYNCSNMRSTLQSEIRLLQSAVRLARNPGPTESIRTISRNSAIAKGLRSDDSASSRPRRSYKEGRNGGDSDVRKDTGGYKG